jgi:hypothetical protein
VISNLADREENLCVRAGCPFDGAKLSVFGASRGHGRKLDLAERPHSILFHSHDEKLAALHGAS